MPRTVPSKLRRFTASIPVIVLLTAHCPALAQQKPAAPTPSSQAKLEEHVKELEKRLDAAEQKAASAAMEKDYITRVQKQYEAYYEKAFNTQVAIVSTLAVFISIVLWIAARFGFQTFDRRIDTTLREASAQLRTEFTQLLEKETQALRESNAAQLKDLDAALTKRITQQEQDLKTRSDYQFQFAQGLASSAAGEYAAAQQNFGLALQRYKSGKPGQLIEKRGGVIAARNIFVLLRKEDEANFEENTKKKLADKLYNDLEEELALAAVDLPWLGPLLKKRKLAPSLPATAQPKTGEAESNEPPPPPTPEQEQ